MTIDLVSAGRRYNRDWVFRGLSASFIQAEPTVVLGGNGSGKSTLLRVLSGLLSLSEGKVVHTGNEVIDPSKVFSDISIAAPYLSLYDFFTLRECIEFQAGFKPSIISSTDEIIACSGLKDSDKPVKYFSSGMMQRLRLTLAFAAKTSVLLLDEPLSNLDKSGVVWYKSMCERFTSNRTVVVFSNHFEEEFFFCKKEVRL